MSGTKEQTKLEIINDVFSKKYGNEWKVYGNEPDHPFTVIANDSLEIVTQIFEKNYELKRWMRFSWYHPKLTLVELEAKAKRRAHTGMFKTVDIIPTIHSQKEWYKNFVQTRKKKI